MPAGVLLVVQAYDNVEYTITVCCGLGVNLVPVGPGRFGTRQFSVVFTGFELLRVFTSLQRLRTVQKSRIF